MNILLTAFQGTSAELLIKNATEYITLFLPNDKIKDSRKLIDVISNGKFDYIVSFGQRPNIRNKVHIETTAKEGEQHIITDFDFNALKDIFKEKGINAKISDNAGTSYCNQLYFNGLRYIFQNQLDMKMIFIHIPFAKNITDFDLFRKQIFESIACIRNGERGCHE